jgi:polynucleotide 5'-hydroxyl-kinase GRC3/NOL9
MIEAGNYPPAQNNSPPVIPPEWINFPYQQLKGVIMIVGAVDTGKSTLARYLYERLSSHHSIAFLDGDPGQSTLGPPGTLTLRLGRPAETEFPPRGESFRWFIGSSSPRRHMLPLIVGAERCVLAAINAGAETIIYDTTGLIEPRDGGVELKMAKINLLQPQTVIAISRGEELNPLLHPLRRSGRTQLLELRAAQFVQARDREMRQRHRRRQFQRYFRQGKIITVDWAHYGVFPRPEFSQGQVLALEDAQGFTRGLGLVTECSPASRRLSILTPCRSLQSITTLHLGDFCLQHGDYGESLLPPTGIDQQK